MRTGRSAALMLWMVAALSGCASGILDVGYPAATAPSPPMHAVAQARRVVIRPVVDRRLDDTRIGPASKNGEAMVSRRPVRRSWTESSPRAVILRERGSPPRVFVGPAVPGHDR